MHGRRLAFALAGALLTVAGRPVAAPAEVTVVDASGRGVGTLLLAGIAFAALASSLTGLIAYASDDRELRDLTLRMLGSLWRQLAKGAGGRAWRSWCRAFCAASTAWCWERRKPFTSASTLTA
jgi:hypothetical protein